MDCSEKTDSVTGLLKSWSDGDPTALDKLLTIVYQEFRNMAGHMMANQRKNHTLQPTALVNEVYLRLLNVREQTFENRTEFYKYVAEIMRNILVSHARYKLAVKRGGNKPHIPVDLVELPWESPATPEELIEVDRMLKSF
jgi:RNA polymerase sigma factor (TIGR02999 family)